MRYMLLASYFCLKMQICILFTGVTNTISIPIGWEDGGWAGSHEVVGKGYLFTKSSQMASISAIFLSTYRTKLLNPWPSSSASCVVNYNRLSACQVDMEPFEGDPNTHGWLTSLRNKPQQSSLGNFRARINS